MGFGAFGFPGVLGVVRFEELDWGYWGVSILGRFRK